MPVALQHIMSRSGTIMIDGVERNMQYYLENLSIPEAIDYLELHLLSYEPEQYVLQHIKTVRDVYEHRTALKAFSGTNRIISHIGQILVDTIEEGKRMRTLDCLKVLRALVKKANPGDLKPETVRRLFRIYQQFIFRDNEDIQWCVSAILKDKPLTDSAIGWLVQNCNRSDHIANRLLLYPEAHGEITIWAERVYREDGLPHRRSDLIAVLLTVANADRFAAENDANAFVWAVFKSRLPTRQKIALLKKYSCFEAFASVVEIADRLGSPDLLRHFLKKLK